jgi:RNA polymerase sigma-70 factor (ECF subfamily)
LREGVTGVASVVRLVGGAAERAEHAGGQQEPAPPSDEELVLLVQEGDRSAEDALVRRHARDVARIASRLLGSRDEMEDLSQDVFLAAFEQLGRLNKPAAFRGWLLRIAINKSRMRIRKRRVLRLLGLDRATPDASLEAIAATGLEPDARAELAEIDEVLWRLPVEQRIAWVLRHVEGHTVRDVSRLTGCSLATAKRRLAEAHRRVLEAVDVEVLRHGR